MGPRLIGVAIVLGLAVAGCTGSVDDGAVWRSSYAEGMTGVIIGGSQCTPIRTTSSQSIDSKTSHRDYAFRSYSADGVIEESVFVRPEGTPDDVDVDADTGELVAEYRFDRAFFESQELVQDSFPTPPDKIVYVAYWFAEECERNPEPPEGYGP